MLRRDLLLNVLAADEVGDFGIESRTGHLLQQRQRIFALHSFSIRAIASRRVIKIDYGNNSRHQWNLTLAQAAGIPTAVPLFVVIANDVFDRVREVDSLQDVTTHGWMDLHLVEFCFGEFAWLVEDILGNRAFADVMQQCAGY